MAITVQHGSHVRSRLSLSTLPQELTFLFGADFQVNDSLPGISFDLGNNYAGNIGVQRPNHPNDTLFFWGFEKENGSLSNINSTEPWGIWLNGG